MIKARYLYTFIYAHVIQNRTNFLGRPGPGPVCCMMLGCRGREASPLTDKCSALPTVTGDG